MGVAWDDMEPWFEELSDWVTLMPARSKEFGGHVFPVWWLSLRIPSEDHGECGPIGEETCPTELAVRLRELLEIVKLASVSSDLALWSDIIGKHHFGWRVKDTPYPAILSDFRICFEGGGSMAHIAWLEAFTAAFLLPIDELSTCDAFNAIISELRDQQRHEEDLGLQMASWVMSSEGDYYTDHVPCRHHICFGTHGDDSPSEWETGVVDAFVEWFRRTGHNFRRQWLDFLPQSDSRPKNLRLLLHWDGLPVISATVKLLYDLYDATSIAATSMRWDRSCYCPDREDHIPHLHYLGTDEGTDPILRFTWQLHHAEVAAAACEAVREAGVFPRFSIGNAIVDAYSLPRLFGALWKQDGSTLSVTARKDLEFTLPHLTSSSLRVTLNPDEENQCVACFQAIGSYITEFKTKRTSHYVTSCLLVFCPRLRTVEVNSIENITELMSVAASTGLWSIEHFILLSQKYIVPIKEALRDQQHPAYSNIAKVTLKYIDWQEAEHLTIVDLDYFWQMPRPLEIDFPTSYEPCTRPWTYYHLFADMKGTIHMKEMLYHLGRLTHDS
ncbi:hypothetical protein Poli38472_011199 [Pythium oligandrum]|uniref:Uncharacterized protein n=1 Tax=Pythium oligandrum TaxID=41045 RepID=A0A8K1CQV1_PYTOL|nr:hypothetical protein Poli38472_011199 [Pythium oligandrum]|eukprot:TMW67579.1 hypothetical protein Poli38472_011199 [Pythium oligandrum]